MKKRLMALFLCGVMTVGMMPTAIAADVEVLEEGTQPTEVVASGTCGENISWSYNQDHVLTISGSGRMDNYEACWGENEETGEREIITEETNMPWVEYLNEIKEIEVSGDITYIGDMSFAGCAQIERIDFLNVTSEGLIIGQSAFYGCRNLKDVNLTENVTGLEASVFANCDNLKRLVLPETIFSFGKYSIGYRLGNNPSINDALTVICAKGSEAYKYCKGNGITYELDDSLHHYNEGTVLSEPSCTSEGSIRYDCDVCTVSKVEKIPALNHNLTEKSETSPTCTENGYKIYYVCKTCKKMFRNSEGTEELEQPEAIPATGHELKKTNEVSATCTKNGTAAYYTCENCGKLFRDAKGKQEIEQPDTLQATGHDLKKTDEVPATCTKNGTAAYYTCENCGKLFRDAKGKQEIKQPDTLQATGHDLKKTDEVSATCTKNGTAAYYTCENCGKLFRDAKGKQEIEQPDTLQATGHDLKKTDEVPATCTKNGTAAYYTCENCGKLFRDAKGKQEIEQPDTLRATGHDLKKTDEVPATCTKNGTAAYYTCENCGNLFRDAQGTEEISQPEVLKAKGHEVVKTEAKKPTTAEPGNSEYWTCTVCGKYLKYAGEDLDGTAVWEEIEKDSWVIPVHVHSFDNGRVTKKPTCTRKGVKTYTCACGEKKTEDIPALGHDWKVYPTVKATPSKNGRMEYRVCQRPEDNATPVVQTIFKASKIRLSKKMYKYDGKKHTPTVRVKDSRGKKIASKNYTIRYASGRKKVGTYKVTVTFRGKLYTGKKVLTFRIKK